MTTGYDPDFIGDGIAIPLPRFDAPLRDSVLRRPNDLRDELFSDHPHFTVVMNRHTRQPIYTAHNINQAQFRTGVKGATSWGFDDAVGKENQLGNEYYKDRLSAANEPIPNPYDRGHMVMRFNNVWGSTDTEADDAGGATFIYSNASLQHKNLNRDEWRALELNVVRRLVDDTNDRLSVFTGPIYGDLDRHINLSDSDSARVPSGFFKVICFRLKGGVGAEKLGVYAFAIFQDDEVLRDLKGNATVKTNRNYQVTITELRQLTNIDFGQQLLDRNPLFFTESGPRRRENGVTMFPERIPLNGAANLVVDPTQRRRPLALLAARRVVIASAMVNPIGGDAAREWISLHNVGGDTIDVDGWTLADSQERETVLHGQVESGASLRLLPADIGTIKLSNAGGGLMLHDEQGRVIDHVTWSRGDVDRCGEGVAVVFAQR